jgi:hypothetical protein
LWYEKQNYTAPRIAGFGVKMDYSSGAVQRERACGNYLIKQ